MALRGGRYETLRVIASGGMATVHLGRALGAGGFERLVAIKVMHAHIAAEPEFVAMFLDEGRLAARIRHPNVVSTIDVDEDEDGLFLVMEYIEGPSLHHLARALNKKSERIPLDVGLRIFLDTLAGLHAAHELCSPSGEPLNLVHRDVSPQNILIGVDGISRITDFGVARAESRLSNTSAGTVKGKFAYMAPEQIKSGPIDARADVYAAGAVLWEIFTGQRLVRGDNDAALMDHILRSEHPSPREKNPELPEQLAEACMRALRREPDDRYRSAAAFAEALEDAARAAGVAIATPRAVAAFIKALDIHKSPTDLPSPPSTSQPVPSGRSMPPSARSGSARASTSTDAGAISGATPLATTGTSPVMASTNTGAVVSTPIPIPQARRPSTGVLVAAGAGVLVVSGALFFVVGPVRVTWGDAASSAPSPSATTSAALVSDPHPAVTTAPTEATTEAPAASAAPASAPSSSASARPKAPSKSGPPRGRPAPTATTFRPKEL